MEKFKNCQFKKTGPWSSREITDLTAVIDEGAA